MTHWSAGRVVSALCLPCSLFSVSPELMACFGTLGNSKSLFLQKRLVFCFPCFYLHASHYWRLKPSVLVLQLQDILSCFLNPFSFLSCLEVSSSEILICPVSTKDILHFQSGSVKCHHLRHSQNFHLCLCTNYYQLVYCFHHGSLHINHTCFKFWILPFQCL